MMSKRGEFLIWGASTVLAVVVIASVLVSFAIYRQGFPWSHMDWDENGATSVSEALSSLDVGRRAVTVEGAPCFEYYSLKDAMPLRVVCEGGNSDRIR